MDDATRIERNLRAWGLTARPEALEAVLRGLVWVMNERELSGWPDVARGLEALGEQLRLGRLARS